VAVIGTAVIDSFQRYELYYKAEPSGDDAYIYFHGNTVQVNNGQLGVWSTGGLPPGAYSLRLRVVKSDANYAEYFSTNLNVNQAAVSASPTVTPTSSEPTPTPIPTSTFTPAPQPTPLVGQVAQPQLEAAATPTSTPEAVAVVVDPGAAGGGGSVAPLEGDSGAADAAESGSFTRELGEALSISRLRTQFMNGVRFSAALLLGVVALYGGKRLFDWVWTQFT
jgi:hypothetical protein